MPTNPIISTRWKQTKNFAYRESFLGRIILQVEEECYIGEADFNEHGIRQIRWRDARLGDWIEYGVRD